MSTRNFSNRRFKTRSSGRPAFKRGGSSGFGGRKKNTGEYINPALFINKAVITEEVEHFVPEHNFQDFNVDQTIKKAIASKGYITPTPIQDRAITHILSGSDVVGIANTGTGKTAAFLIPLINKVILNRKEMVLIVVPTRELALQIESELQGFTRGMRIFSVCCVGGASMGRQISQLRNQYNFIIGTPGRLKDHIEHGFIRLANFRTIVLDEADRMLDMGFINDMRFVMAGMPKERQTLFFSATLSRDIDNLIYEFLRQPVKISVKTRDTAKNVEQDVVRMDGKDKVEVLHDLLSKKTEFCKVLIFGRTKHGVERLSQTLERRGFKSGSIHGNKNQSQRQRALSLFKNNYIQILVATDVAARGLDIADVSHVINYDLPATYDDYVHRIGRTGRADKRGKALTFLD
ncbi:MAG TPA: DEAD/DEAH box helicase [Candidatus Paceibacterota bacterium]